MHIMQKLLTSSSQRLYCGKAISFNGYKVSYMVTSNSQLHYQLYKSEKKINQWMKFFNESGEVLNISN